MMERKNEIKKGITAHTIKTDKFKTDLIAVFLSTKLSKEDVTKNALIPMLLKKGSNKLDDVEKINKQLDEMYGACFDCGIDKIGDNQVLKFYVEIVDNKYLPENEDLLKMAIDTILELVFNPKVENGGFKKEYTESEKQRLKTLLEGRKDNKAQYAMLRCQEEMYKGVPFGLYKYGYVEDLDGINEKNLYEHYKKLISECKIDVFVSGDIDEQKVFSEITENSNIKSLNEREPIYSKENIELEKREERQIIDKLDVTQGNLVIGLVIDENNKKEKYVAMLYNSILGGSPTSKLFQIVREKHSLAYTAGSNYLRHKNCIFVKCGIEIDNYEKTLKLIREQIEDMKKGNFTEEDIKNSKTGITSVIKTIPEEQDTQITYYMGQELAEFKMEFDEYEKEIEKVTKEEIVSLANKVKIDTVFFLRN